MSTQPLPGTTPAAVSAAVSSDSETLKLLVQLLLAERQEAMLDREEKKKARVARDDQRKQNSEYNLLEKRQSQSLCSHKKGGRGLKGPKVDYAVSFHTFVNGESYIRCLICGMKWKNTDTDEFLIRRGVKVENHTRVGWRRAFEMVTESSNTATSSEVKLTAAIEPHAKPDFKNDPRAVEI